MLTSVVVFVISTYRPTERTSTKITDSLGHIFMEVRMELENKSRSNSSSSATSTSALTGDKEVISPKEYKPQKNLTSIKKAEALMGASVDTSDVNITVASPRYERDRYVESEIERD